MKRKVLVLACLFSFAICFMASMGLAKEERLKSLPIPETNSIAIEKQNAIEEDFDQDLFADYEDQVENVQMVADPLYYFNYAMFSFNDFLYFYALKPIALGYKAITPDPVRNGVNNVFYNLMFPVRFVNNILQGKLVAASDEFGVFLANSTLGVLGFNQFAQKHLNMTTSDEDLGQTFGSYAIGDGLDRKSVV